MGLFDLIRKNPATQPAMPPLLGELIERYALEKKEPAEGSLSGTQWWEGRDQGRLIAFMERGRDLALYAGEPAEITEIYLVRAAPDESPALAATKRHIERITGTQGAALAAQFRLGAQPAGALFDLAPLRLPALLEGIPRLSASVREVMIFDNLRGLSLALDASATRDTIDADLKLAHAVLQALEAAE